MSSSPSPRAFTRASFTSFAWLAALAVVGCSGTATGTLSDGGTSTSTGPGADGTGAAGGANDQKGAASPAPVDLDALFGAPATTSLTEDVLTGLWSGSAGSADVRLKLTASSLTIAVKCSSARAVGAEIAATVSANAIRILASKDVQDNSSCTFSVRPMVISKCGSPGAAYECFDLQGTTLYLRAALFSVGGYTHGSNFTKLSD